MAVFSMRKQESTFSVIIDIGSGSIGASIVEVTRESSLPHIHFAVREFIPRPKANTPASRIRSMKTALLRIVDAVAQASRTVPHADSSSLFSHTLVIATAPWSKTVTQIIHFEQKEPFTITHDLVNKLIAHAGKKTERARKRKKEVTLAERGMHPIEHSVVDISLNGYTSDEPYGERALEIDVAYLTGLVEDEVMRSLEEMRERTLGHAALRIHSSALVTYCVLRDLYPKTSHALIIDISGDATEISIMQHHVLYEAHTIRYGTHDVIDDIANHAKAIPEEARMYMRQKGGHILTAKQEKVLVDVEKRYALAIEKALRELTSRYALPRTIYLVSDEDAERFFTEVLAYALHGKGGHREKTVVPLTPLTARDLATWDKKTAPDSRLALSARFFHKLHACGEIDN